MSHPARTPTPTQPRFDRLLLAIAAQLVPPGERDDWQRSWQAELWHGRHQALRPGRKARNPQTTSSPTLHLAPGLLRDALWLRAESWTRLLRGTATLALLSLAGLCLLAALLGLALAGTPHALALRLAELAPCIALATLLVAFVTYAVAPPRPADRAATTTIWLRRQLYLVSKLALLLAGSWLLSLDLTAPLSAPHPATADFFEVLAFVLLSLLALRWAVADGEQRCKHCLRALAAPARVGRPSRNLLEWNGTELRCTRGHGRLTIPELETSWCQRSAWILPPPPTTKALPT